MQIKTIFQDSMNLLSHNIGKTKHYIVMGESNIITPISNKDKLCSWCNRKTIHKINEYDSYCEYHYKKYGGI